MEELDLDAMLFFDAVPGAYSIYRALKRAILKIYPNTQIRMQKTQITFYNPRVFACASLLRARRKAEMPDSWITVTLGLPYRLESPRAAVCTEPYPGRWTAHIVLGSSEEINDELLQWIGEAYVFAAAK
ncbi:MAG: hypothetical protein IK099_07680 [Clostridia bacterium]|nr:hypothetical protein [Clostridia bacterium]